MDILIGWKAISSEVGVTTRTLKNWQKKKRLKVLKILNVVAVERPVLKAWLIDLGIK